MIVKGFFAENGQELRERKYAALSDAKQAELRKKLADIAAGDMAAQHPNHMARSTASVAPTSPFRRGARLFSSRGKGVASMLRQA